MSHIYNVGIKYDDFKDLPEVFFAPEPEDEVFELTEEVAPRDQAEALLATISLRSAAQPFEHTPISVLACETLLDVRAAIGSEGIRAWLDYIEEFDARIGGEDCEVDPGDEFLVLPPSPYLGPDSPLHALAEARGRIEVPAGKLDAWSKLPWRHESDETRHIFTVEGLPHD